MALAGALACQKDSYLKELTTNVIGCESVQLDLIIKGKKQKVSAFEVTLEDTVLFPEGGGQPDDRGKIDDADVLRVTRRGGDTLHYIRTPVDIGSKVKLKVDWPRRFDHMQQHSGQHLITAVAEKEFGFATTSWNLGEKISSIELDSASMSMEQMTELEEKVNDLIMAGIRMYPSLYASASAEGLVSVRTRGLPEDHVGPVRVVTIEGVESNMCCGTHVSSLSHLQSIKLLHVEKGKKGKINLLFVAGNRVLNYLADAYSNERSLTSLLKGPPCEHAVLVTKLQNSAKLAQKNSMSLLRDVAVLEADRFIRLPERPSFMFLHRREGDNEFMNIIVNQVNDPSVVFFLSTGDEKGTGLFLLSGPEETITKIHPQVAEILKAKGACKNGRFQGKASKLSKRHLVEKLIQDEK